MNNLKKYSDDLERALLVLDQQGAEKIILDACQAESPMLDAGELVACTLERIGNAWSEDKLSLSQVYMSGVICEKLIDKIIPPASLLRKDQPKMAIAVFEDYHLLGKRIVFSTLRASGFELLDLGGGLNADDLVAAVKQENIKILLLSVLMLPSALRIKDLKRKLTDIDVRIVVGGAPFRLDSELWKEVGADAYGSNSAEALTVVSKLMEEKK
ncbi:MAG: cobalamin-dependent protein [Victivallaceae bacterium]